MRNSSKPLNPNQASMPRYVWGARAIGEFFNLDEREVFYRAKRKQLPGVDYVGRTLVGDTTKMSIVENET
jgi:hypothetical protein